jgi:DNA (cytosine-5)-methyltransferase 1
MGRPRVFVVAYANRDGERLRSIHAEVAGASEVLAARADWSVYPAPHLGVVDGCPHRVDRLRTLGNAVVPACAEVVGRALMDAVGSKALVSANTWRMEAVG